MIDFKKELNSAQYDVVVHGDGPCLVLAGAGSGKTRTLVYRVAYLLEKGVKPERILLLTFTNKAAKEMLSRVDELLKDKKQASGLWGGTFHHVANRLLRSMGPAVGLKNNFTILDREDSKDLIKRCIKELSKGDTSKRLPQPGIFLEVISYAINAQMTLEDALAKKYVEGLERVDLFKAVAERYEQKKKSSQSLDFDDLLVYWLRLLQKPKIREKLQGMWEYILVDEYQDTNVVQDAIVRALSEKHRNVLVVGDDAQSIYSFRAADINHILNFPKHFPDAHVYKLEENYRSSPEILEVANQVISHNTAQFKKNLFTRGDNFLKPEVIVMQDAAEEASKIAERIIMLEDEGVPIHQIAVLFRAAHTSQAIELELNSRSIPYEVRGGLRFFERAHIKDILAFVRLVANPADEAAWFRVIQMYEGIGEVTAQKIVALAKNHAEWDAILGMPSPSGAAASAGWREFVRTMSGAVQEKGNGAAAIIRSVRTPYAQFAQTMYPDFKDRLDDIDQLALFAERYTDLDAFLSETTLQEAFALRTATSQQREAGVILSTIHQAKGLEWHTVFVINVSNNAFPHPKAMNEEGGLEEERRLFYVAITRAQRRLYLTYPLSASRYSISLNQPSQFLREVKKELLSGDIEEDDEPVYDDSESDGEHFYLPSIDRL